MNDNSRPSQESLRHLLLTIPELEVQESGDEVIDSLIEGTICKVLEEENNLQAILTPDDLLERILQDTGLEYTTAEVVASLERLEERDHLEFSNRDAAAFQFARKRYEDIKSVVDRRKGRLSEVRGELVRHLSDNYTLSSNEHDILWSAFDNFVAHLVHHFAAEAAAFLYSDDEGGEVRFYDKMTARLPQLSEYLSDELLLIGKEVFPNFIRNAPGRTSEFLSSRLRVAFYYHMLSIDPSASKLVREHVSNKTLVLDTNFVYRLLGFHGPTLAYNPALITEIGDELNCRFVVTGQTLKEFTTSLQNNVETIKSYPLKNETYRRVAADHPAGETDFMGRFFKEWRSGQVAGPDEFLNKYMRIKPMLEEWGICIEEDVQLSDTVKQSESFRDEYSELNQFLEGRGKFKDRERIEHDVFLRSTIKDLREGTEFGIEDINVWALTYDHHLSAYSAYKATGEDGQSSEVIMASDWLQMVRPFLPRTEQYEESFTAMLGNPLLYHDEEDVVPLTHVVESLNRLERYADLPEEVASGMMANTAFIRQLREAPDDEAEREIINSAALEVAEDFADEKKELEQKLDERSSTLEEVQLRLEEAEGTAKELRQTSDGLREEKEKLEEELSSVGDKLDTLEENYEEKIDEVRGENQSLKAWLLYIGLALPVLLAAAVVLASQWTALSIQIRAFKVS